MCKHNKSDKRYMRRKDAQTIPTDILKHEDAV